MLWSSVAGKTCMVDYSSLDGCVLVSLHRNPCWNIWNSTSSEVSQTFPLNIWDTSGHLNITWCLQSVLLLVGSQQSVLEAGCALFTTSPSTELVFETDFFWFLEIFERVILWHEYDVSEIESNLVNLSSSAAASDLTAALSKRKHGEAEVLADSDYLSLSRYLSFLVFT